MPVRVKEASFTLGPEIRRRFRPRTYLTEALSRLIEFQRMITT